MMVKERMAYGANLGLARQFCAECNSETLHRSSACVHCGTIFQSQAREGTKSAQERFKDGLQIKRRRA